MSRLAAIILAAGQGIRMRSKLAKVLHPACGRPMVLYDLGGGRGGHWQEKMSRLAAIILAAGQGIRMRSKLAKVLHPACGRPMVLYAVDLAETLAKGHVAVVVGYQAERVKDLLADRKVTLVDRTRRLGTGHAVAQAQAAFQGRGGNEWSGRRFVILSGDTPLLTEATVQALLATHERERATVTLLTAHLDQPAGYGRIVRGRDGSVWRIIEDKDATPAERR